PVLAMLCALTRDVLLSSTIETIVDMPEGTVVPHELFAHVAAARYPDRYSAASLRSLGRNIASSWQQSGHLSGKLRKIRVQAVCRPNNAVYALLLGYIQGGRGESLFHTRWARVLDATPYRLHEQARSASQRGWMEYRRSGDVVEIGFRHLLREFQQGIDT
ncbi:MAG TPA: hypothetical protein VFT99_24650, partial [Roseiflexaceae bacterium]|nr:hypothetical protein [Roseiflexaceae bacterium]